MSWSEETRLTELLETQPELEAWLEWRGVDVSGGWELEETLGELCEQWDLEWEELTDELTEWLTEEEPVRMVEWNEPLQSGEE
jgi:hypothetical protein